MLSLQLFAQTMQYDTTSLDSTGSGSPAGFIFGLLIALVVVVALWRVFQKAGKPGWAAIIPFYNLYTLLTIVGRPVWWIILYLIPIVNVIVHLVVAIDLAKAFGKDAAFGVLALWLFSPIGMLILAFSSATYHGGSATPPAAPTASPSV